jgi:Arc/MetJ-type ribon-helix-helix transcriptional regulator
MTMKIAISLPDEHVAAARRAVADGRAPSVSAYVAQTIAERLEYEDVAALLAEMAAATRPPDDDDRRWARTALGLD